LWELSSHIGGTRDLIWFHSWLHLESTGEVFDEGAFAHVIAGSRGSVAEAEESVADLFMEFAEAAFL
jgi:hypothetical protein